MHKSETSANLPFVWGGYNLGMENFNSPVQSLSSVLGSGTGSSDAASLHPGSLESTAKNTQAKETSRLLSILSMPAMTALILGVLAFSLFLAGIQRPPMMYFDEGLFVPEAQMFLLAAPAPSPLIQMHSLAKPPLGKMIMAAGIKLAGDNPFGWRVASAVCGALTLVAVYFWGLLLVQDRRLAAMGAVLTLFNNFLFVMSRIGMMDVFLVFFLMWSLSAYTAALVLDVGVGKRRVLLIGSGFLMGLAGACKWNAIDNLAVLIVISVVLLCVARRTSADSKSPLAAYAHKMQEIGTPALAS